MEAGTFYHYYNRGNNHENIFREEANYRYFLQLLKKHILLVAEVYSYCLLPNHFHLIVRIKDSTQLPPEYRFGEKHLWQPFSNFFNAYAKAFNKKYGRTGSLFQKIPKQLKIEETRYLMNLILYVNTNSVHHGISDYNVYPYSSYPILIASESTKLKRTEVLELFDGLDNFEEAMRSKNRQIEDSQQTLLEDD